MFRKAFAITPSSNISFSKFLGERWREKKNVKGRKETRREGE
jgi:hypothetical protein